MDNPVSYIILTFILICSFYYVFNMAQKEKEERRIESEEFWYEYDRNLKNVKKQGTQLILCSLKFFIGLLLFSNCYHHQF